MIRFALGHFVLQSFFHDIFSPNINLSQREGELLWVSELARIVECSSSNHPRVHTFTTYSKSTVPKLKSTTYFLLKKHWGWSIMYSTLWPCYFAATSHFKSFVSLSEELNWKYIVDVCLFNSTSKSFDFKLGFRFG